MQLSRLIAQTKSDDWEKRQKAIEELSKIDDIRAKIAFHLADGNWEELIRIGKESIPSLILALKDDDSWVRIKATEILGRIGGDRATESIIRIVKGGDEDWEVWETAVQALRKLSGDGKVVSLLTEILKNNDTQPNMRNQVFFVLRNIGWVPPQEEENQYISYFIFTGMWGKIVEIGREAMDLLIECLKDENQEPAIHAGAAWSLGMILPNINDSKPGVDVLIRCLKDKNKNLRIRWNAAWALGSVGSYEAGTPLLETFLNEPGIELRWAIAEALGKIKFKEALYPLIDELNSLLINSLNEYHPGLTKAIIKALSRLRDPAAVESIIPWLNTKFWNVREVACHVLGEFRDERAIAPLIACLKDEYHEVREAAITALIKIKTTQMIPLLLKLLKDENPEVRRACVRVMVKINDPIVHSLLIELSLSDKHFAVRDAAREGIRC